MKATPKKTTFILDLGSATIKLGVVSDDRPMIIIPSYTEYAQYESEKSTTQILSSEITRTPLLNEKNIPNLIAFSEFLKFSFSKLGSTTNEQQLIITQSNEWSNELTDRLKTLLFQNFQFDSIYMGQKSYFCILNDELINGVVVDIGNAQTRISPYKDSKVVSNALIRSPIAGNTTNEYLKALLSRQFRYIRSPIFDWFIEKIKIEKCAYVENLEKTLADVDFLQKNMELIEIPQFNVSLELGIEKYLCPEVLFEPKLANLSGAGINDALAESIVLCPASIRKEVYSNIIIAGASAKLKNFQQRIKTSFSKIALLSNAQLIIGQDPEITVWKGMKRFLEEGLYDEYATTQTKFFARL